jgi:hypothetical protein
MNCLFAELLRGTCKHSLTGKKRRYLLEIILHISVCMLHSYYCPGPVTLTYLQMPDMLNWFGWCTWDAFYTDVTAEGVKDGLQRCFIGSRIFLSIIMRELY